MEEDPTGPVACSLPSAGFSKRMLWIAALNQDALLSYERTERLLTIRYSLAAEARVRELVRREEQCCAFLRFTIQVAPPVVVLAIEAPEEAAANSQTLFTQFVAKQPSGDGCACSSSGPVPLDDPKNGRVARVAATSGAAAAIACGVCCVIPLVFPAVAITTFGAAVAAFAGVYWWAMRIGFVALTVGWLWLALVRIRDRRRIGRATWVAMALATLVVILAYGWSFLEPYVVAALRR